MFRKALSTNLRDLGGNSCIGQAPVRHLPITEPSHPGQEAGKSL